jgi:uncharacterized membrane protein YccC
MSRVATLRLAAGHFGLTVQALHHGMQLGVAVLLGYGVAVVLGLPERFWVVITVLIVMRADADSALDAGWDRVRGTVVGALSGLLGVYLQHLGVNAILVTLAIVSLMAFASAAVPMLRSAAVAALIILGAGELAGYPVVHVAVLRVLQIGIGVGVSVALALATSRYSTRARLLAGCAALLRRLALQLQTRGLRAATTAAQADARSAAVRNALQGLATLAASADRKFPWSRGKGSPLHERHYRHMAALTSRVVQDAGVLNRVLNLMPASQQGQLAREAVDAASAALSTVAQAISATGQPSLGALRQLAKACEAGAGATGPLSAMLAAPLRLLLDDLQQLCDSTDPAAIFSNR